MVAVVSHGWSPVDLSAVDREPLLPEIGGLYTPGSTHLVSGEPESCKSWLAMTTAVDQLCDGHTVVWVDFEMGARQIVQRLQDLGVSARDEELTNFVLLAPVEPLGPGSEAAAYLDNLIAVERPSLVVVDAMTGALDLHGLSSNSDTDVESLYRLMFDRLAAHGAAVVVLDHLAKDAESRGKYAVGSQRKVGRADVHLGVESVKTFARGRDGLVKIKVQKDRHGSLARPYAGELELHSDAASGAISWEIRLEDHTSADKPFRPTVLMERVSRYAESADGLVSRTTVEGDVIGNSGGIRLAIDCLVREKFLRQTDGQRRSKLLEVIRPYREADDEQADDDEHAEVERLAAKFGENAEKEDDA